jgi:hypothetical protein
MKWSNFFLLDKNIYNLNNINRNIELYTYLRFMRFIHNLLKDEILDKVEFIKL